MKSSESITKLAKALSDFQREVKNPANTASAKIPTKTGKGYSYQYATLPDVLNLVRPLLAKHGLSIVQMPGGNGRDISMTTTLLHESGEWIESEPLTLKADDATAQGAGSAITYARRYSLSAVLGISSEDDDDGNYATQAKKSTPKEKPAPKPAAKSSDNPRGKFFAQLREWAGENMEHLPYETVEETAKSWMREKIGVDSLSEVADSSWRTIVNDRMHVVFNAVESILLDDAFEEALP